MNKTKIFLADDHAIFLKGLTRVLEEDNSLEIAGTANDGNTALEKILSIRPDIIIMDISMPGLNGLQVSEKLMETGHRFHIILLTIYSEEEIFRQALQFNVKGYVLKDQIADDILDCIRIVRTGKSYISPSLSDYLIRPSHNTAPNNPALLEKLTAQEVQVLKLLAENKTSSEIASSLFISTRTVQNHRAHITQKLGLTGRHKLLEFALSLKNKLQ